MSRWYRAYEGTVNDPKLAEAALVAEASRSVVIATWHAILESCASTNDGGSFEITARRIAVILQEPIACIESIMHAMHEIGLLCGGSVAAWGKRQYESDNSTERSRRHRDNKRNADATSRNAGATLQQQHATPPDTDTDTDTDIEKRDTNVSPKKTATRRTKIPDGMPSVTDRQDAAEYWREQGRHDLDPDDQAEKFRDYHRAKGSLMADWEAAWRTWRSNAMRFGGAPPQTQRRESAVVAALRRQASGGSRE